MDRRQFMKLGVVSTTTCFLTSCGNSNAAISPPSGKLPNILWISTEDISPDLGCYGDNYAITPNIDKFAARSIRYDNAFTTAGVCAPMRSATITGMYQNSIGTMHMRCKGVPPKQVKCFTEYLRQAGYYCTNRSKTDYQFDPPFSAWDDNGRKAHWRNSKPGQPFFTIINFTMTHESSIRSPKGKKAKLHDPAKANVPPYYPDTPMVRNDLACYADNITRMDKEVAAVLDQLKDDGLAEDTIVWFWGDHGRGLPRCKRWVYDSGLRIPLIIHVPEKFKKYTLGNSSATGAQDQLVSSLDFAPTMLSLAGLDIPKHLQGQAFLGPKTEKPRKYVFAARDRIDEVPDCVRSIHDGKFIFIRNFMPYVPYSANVDYMNKMPTMKDMRKLNAEGKLKGSEKQYFKYPRDIEELYDIENDPHEVNNLAYDQKYSKVVHRMRKELFKWIRDIKDVGLIPEPEFDAIKRPDDKYETTAPAQFLPGPTATDQPQTIKISCHTQGASIAWRLKGQDKWNLYTKPVQLKPDQTIEAKACRIGFNDSKPSLHKYGSPAVIYEAAAHLPHWQETIYNSDLIESILEIKSYDGKGKQAVNYYFDKLNDKHASVRFWAVRGLTYSDLNDTQNNKANKEFEMMLTDNSPTVRIASAQALCMHSPHANALNVLKDIITNSHNSARHWALVALDAIGPNAKGIADVLETAQNDKYSYVSRVAKALKAKKWD